MTKSYKYQHLLFLFWVREKYKYDALGNMLKMKSVGNWVRDYVYDTDTNRLLNHNPDQPLNVEYTYDEHGNMLTMPHLTGMAWNEKDELIFATNGNDDNSPFKSYYNYDAQGNRTRKVVVKNNVREERYYVGGYEVFRKYVCDSLKFERKTINISDDEKVFVRVEEKTGESEVVRYQYDNHLGSACLELDYQGDIRSYEEYHPFGTTSYRSGRDIVEVSLKRYKYNGKERDEETGLYQYGMRYYAAWLCRFVSCDPLQFEYPHYTPYQYAGNKPITYVDLDGAEEMLSDLLNKGIDKVKNFGNNVKNFVGNIANSANPTELEGVAVTANLIRKAGNVQHFFNPNKEGDPELIEYANYFAENFDNNNVIHIFAHGLVEENTGKCVGLSVYKDGQQSVIRDVEQFEQFLSENFDMWKNRKEGEHTTIVLHSCSTGKGFDVSFAAKMSNLENTTIIAPSKTLNINNSSKTEKVYEWKKDFYNNDKLNKGNWYIFNEGRGKGTLAWDWKPENVINPQKLINSILKK